MPGELIVSALGGEVRAALVRDEALVELLVLRGDAPPQAGDLFLARVERFDKGLDGAFVDLGLERSGLLPKREMIGPPPPEGTALTVKVVRAPAAGKGARVSARVSAAEAARAEGHRAPARLPAGAAPLAGLLRSAAVTGVVADDAALLKQLEREAGADGCQFSLHTAREPLFETKGLETQVEALLQPRVDCAGGSFLLIEPGQTLTAIDVNAGRHDGRGGAEALARQVNHAAVPEIARQLRLRALSGLIVVDFLALRKAEDRKALAAALRRAVESDPEPCQVFGLSPSGLLEMTRRRSRPPLHEVLCRRSGLGGSGWEKTPETLACEALRALAAAAMGRAVRAPGLRAAPAVAEALKGGQAAALAAVEQRLGSAVTVTADPLVERYELVLG
ncbi:ribonuclease E/G [Pelagibius sp.]|uniref:ribonuclease E/G n=1 Tax=Pelagibius sp. TaxID=1931238 RepID=UPI00262BD5C6|nr:ribonuclease E/G [Pelagibius sp.]